MQNGKSNPWQPGAARSIADKLYLQLGIEKRDAGKIVILCNGIAAACLGQARVSKSTTDTILAVFALYEAEIKWILMHPFTQHGLKQATVTAALAMCRAVWADKTADAVQRLETGADLATGNALLPLRNWLMGTAGEREDKAVIRQVTLHHLAAFVDGKSLPQVVMNSNQAYARLLKLHRVRIEQICALYGQPLPECLRAATESAVATRKATAFDADALRIAETLQPVFTSTDLMARTDENVGVWLMNWRNKGWIESAGVNQYKKTEKFGREVVK